MFTTYNPAKTLWSFDAAIAEIFSVSVVAESEKSVYLAPSQEFNSKGRKLQPVLRHKRSLPTFHSFHEAKKELMKELQGQLTASRDCYEGLMEKACRLEAPEA